MDDTAAARWGAGTPLLSKLARTETAVAAWESKKQYQKAPESPARP